MFTHRPARAFRAARLSVALRGLLGLLAVVALLGLSPARVSQAAGTAHPAPSVIHDYLVQLGPSSGLVFLRFSVSPQLVPQVYRLIDTNGDGKTEPAERQAWLDHYLANMQFTVDDKPVTMGLVGASSIDQNNLVVSMEHPVTVTMQLTFTLPADPAGQPPADHHFILADNSNYVNYDEYYASWEDLPGAVTTAHDLTQPANPATFEAIFERDPSTAAMAAPTADQESSPGTSNWFTIITAPFRAVNDWFQSVLSIFTEQLTAFLSNPHRDFGFGLFLFLLATGLGALHALTPGHSKSVVAAYLIGTQGRVRDAVALGGIVTFTHTASVFALGVVLLLITSFVLPHWFQPALELGSGLLIVVLGLYLLPSRLRVYRGAAANLPALEHDHSHPHDHSHEHSHDHDHAHEHSHDHGPGGHTHAPPVGVTPRQLVALGVSGGLVPCPDAIAILLLTLPIGQIGFGLLLVSSFSIGLAAVLIGIGILMVRGKGLLERLLPGRSGADARWVRALPIASAVIVVVLGVALMIGAIVGQKWA